MVGSRQYIVIPGRWLYVQRLKGADVNDKNIAFSSQVGIWSSGMILALGARGPEFDSRNAPIVFELSILALTTPCKIIIFSSQFSCSLCGSEQMEAIQGQRQLFQDTVTFDDDTAGLDSPLAETQVEKLGSYTQVLGDSLENAKHELPSQVIPDNEDEEIHGDQLENAADGVSDVETGIRIKGNGVVGLQMRTPSPRFQWLKDVAEAFVSDGSAGEDKGAGALINAEDSDEKTDCPRLVTCDQEIARLNYVDSEEPGESSQASALGFVDHFLSCSDVNFSPRTELRSTTRKKFPPVLSAKGCQHLAKSFRQRYVPRHQKAGYSDGKGGCRSDNDSEENYEDLHEKVTSSPQTDSRVAGHSVKETRRTGQEYEFISENANASDK
ncbi:PAX TRANSCRIPTION ACTIVATION DOMAIN INTERACTING PROTEIN [Salix viminalis]|uniref:PAX TRANSCRIPTION ACTIVATION DOMAIN INTERACTING PROTEIN n=1 Tax=Salix viminalis TaxID=40686 RepID=A0A9Q0NS06_SALVM|nr:PAX TRANSCRIPTION ACTIVATION DOMAIN INTERACTING PROTEIN [Salix viminalis]